MYKCKKDRFQAIQWNCNDFEKVKTFINGYTKYRYYTNCDLIFVIESLEERFDVYPTDWIIKVNGDLFVCSNRLFNLIFEKE